MLKTSEDWSEIIWRCQHSNKHSSIGKLLPAAFYIHHSAINLLDPLLREYEVLAREIASSKQNTNFLKEKATLIKYSFDRPTISYLYYPNFDREPHPELHGSTIVNLVNTEVSDRYYSESNNPPLLHRKETFVAPDYPNYEKFKHLTEMEAVLGLLADSRAIGTRRDWELRLQESRIAFAGHYLICHYDRTIGEKISLKIDRHKAAIPRKELSRPVRLALEANLFTSETTFFDYGCGYGSDVEKMTERGYQSAGWDPYYYPNNNIIAGDIVNLGYIINVIENPQERREVLIEAWKLTGQILIVSAQILIDSHNRGLIAYEDGIVTSRNTFQKYYQQEELKIYIDGVLDTDSIPVGLGVYFVFKDTSKAEEFRLSRFHSRIGTPKIRIPLKSFAECAELLQPLMDFMIEKGRLPVKGEFNREAEIIQEFGSYRRADQVILQVTNKEEWEMIAEQRRQDLRLYLALERFDKDSSPRQLSPQLKEDIKGLFGSHKQAYHEASMMLYSLSKLDYLAEIAANHTVGKKDNNCLTVHVSVLETLDPLLRLYEGCASRTIGALAEANAIKFSFKKPKITYLSYPDFDTKSHPYLAMSMEIDLRDLSVSYRDYTPNNNPPILHEKDRLILSNYPHYQEFAWLTQQERELEILDDIQNFKLHRRDRWLQYLREKRLRIVDRHLVCLLRGS
jgi:DNA phosphorothioation-associated putative methyltransferase